MNCSNCAAPLPPKHDTCRYCGVKNQIDLRGFNVRSGNQACKQYQCPRCPNNLHEIVLELGENFTLEYCRSCHGLFFDSGELEYLLEEAVTQVWEIDFKRLGILVEHQEAAPCLHVRYIPCPACSQLMNRRNFGVRSGVIIDSCREHGIWLDGGELDRLLRWTKAGGMIHDSQRKNPRVANPNPEDPIRIKLKAAEDASGNTLEVLVKALSLLVSD